MGLVSALGASTSAFALDLDDNTDTPDTYAPDAVLAADLDANDNLVITVAAVETTAIGVGVATGNQIFIRFDLTNAEFSGAVTLGELTVSMTSSEAVAQGGADGGTFVIFDITSGGITQASDVDFAPALGLTGTSAASIQMRVYETLTQAVNETDQVYGISGVFANFSDGVTTVADPATATAEVSADFLLFNTGDGTDGTLGEINWALSGSLEPDGTAVDIATDSDSFTDTSSDVVLSGDVSFGDWYLDATGCTGVAGAEIDLTEDTTDMDSATATDISGLTAAHIVCVEVDGMEEINEGSYSVSFEWDTPATAVYPLADSSDGVGSIVRNGTTVQIPYLTVFEDYNQRLVIVNRSSNDAEYSITFTTEDGTTATAGSAATGTVPANEVLSLRASDIVTTTGTTRTAATLVVVAPNTAIDVATNQVNLSDGSTDTVVLN